MCYRMIKERYYSMKKNITKNFKTLGLTTIEEYISINMLCNKEKVCLQIL